MAVRIYGVQAGSVCAKKGVAAGDLLERVNGHEIDDVLDYRFYCDEPRLRLELRRPGGRLRRFTVRGAEGPDSLGLEFETYLMDRHKSCRNRCIFCFIDQLPKGLRPSLYFKDDDARLSFLFGNYITLTNLSEREAARIVAMHISPVNVSVHTMDPALRVKMMRNPRAGEALGLLKRFSDAGISINAQLVLCPGINDGEALSFSMRGLAALQGVQSVAAVPAGLTKYREGLYPIGVYTPEGAAEVIDRIDAFNAALEAEGREKLVYPSDEFFQLAGRPIPGVSYYGDFPQLENGVGVCALTEAEFLSALAELPGDEKPRRFALVTGTAAGPLMERLCAAFRSKYPRAEIEVHALTNRFFGPLVTAAGLLTGGDIAEQLAGRGFCCENLLVPRVMLKSREEPVFLDDRSVSWLAETLHTAVTVAECDGAALAELFARMGAGRPDGSGKEEF